MVKVLASKIGRGVKVGGTSAGKGTSRLQQRPSFRTADSELCLCVLRGSYTLE